MTYTIKHDRPNCIGCGACVAVNQEQWEMKDDGKSSIKQCVEKDTGWEELGITEREYEKNMEAAQSCPVNVIHIHDKKGKKII